MIEPTRRAVVLGVFTTLAADHADAVGLLSIVKSPPTNPSVTSLLTSALYVPGNWNTFPGSSWAINTPFTDTTGAVMRRITDATNPTANGGMNFEYSEGGPRISRPFGTNLDTYHVAVILNANTGSGEAIVTFDVQRGVGLVAGTYRTSPTIPLGGLCYCWSQKSTEPHILFFSNKTTTDLIHRYDINAGAYAPNAVFSGTNASISAGGNNAGWLSQNWAGTHMFWMTPYFAPPTALHYLDLGTGAVTNYSGAEISLVNDVRISKGSANVCVASNNDGTKGFWFVNTNVMTAPFTSSSTQGHAEMGESLHYILNADSSNFPLIVTNVGTAPASDGGAATATETTLYNAGAGTQMLSGDQLPCMSWDQTGAGTGEWYCFGTDAGVSNKNNQTSANGWTIDSGSVYKTAVTYGSPDYGLSARGIKGVLTLDGSGTFIGNLTPVGSRGAVVAGTYYWDGTTLYVQMPTSGTPVGFTRLLATGQIDEGIGYARQDGTATRKLCNTYRNQQTYAYEMIPFANWSPDGKIAIFGSNFGVNAGRVDLVMCEVPLA